MLVAGAGPAGLKAAAVLAERGHEVTLYEAAPREGGQALLAQLLPGRAEFGGIVTNLAREVELAGVSLRRRTTVTRALIETEAPEVATGEELTVRFGEVEAKSVERIRKLGLLVPLGDDRFEVPSPALMRAAEEVTALGIPLQAALVLVERLSRDCESIARDFVKLFMRELWMPFERAGQPEESWDATIEAIERLRSIASEALLAMFKQRMTVQVERAFGKVLEQQAKRAS